MIMNILHDAVNLQPLDNTVIHDYDGLMSLANKPWGSKTPPKRGLGAR
ncbi:Uncharacterised protein [Serratia grimesii]|nr:Uncharacterised protein [Serratia grimesii]CAI2435640.1 Uncharacterised protein [Serratia grimesii]CUW17014.1 Uncharacterised protein [Serratia grimesii]SMZ56614.1 Uncharacterised protein [Serratia grimesii]SUI33321.1 Uncharacterised protein [Serratia grimesii]